MASAIRTLCLLSSFTYQIAYTQECSEGTFGEDCSSSCSARHCVNQSRCDPVSGFCENGCLAGWSGLTCMQNVTGGVDAEADVATTGRDIVIALTAALSVLMVLMLLLQTVMFIRPNLNPGSSKMASTRVNKTVHDRNPTSYCITSTFTDNSTRRDNITASNTDSSTPTDHIDTGITSGNAIEHIYNGIALSNAAIAAKPSHYETLQWREDNPYTSLEGRNVIVN